MTTPQCKHCHRNEPEVRFGRHDSGTPRSTCEACRNTFSAPRKAKQYRNSDKLATKAKLRGFEKEELEALIFLQDNKCAICERSFDEFRMDVDHNHSCPENHPKNKSCQKCFRGLLCGPCNQALGLFRDQPDLMRRAAEYIEVEAFTPR